MTEAQIRNKVVAQMQAWIGCNESDGSHKKIIDTYNGHKPLARNYAVRYTDAWCATTVSAAGIACGLSDIIPPECGCGNMIQLFQKAGRWQENDAYKPQTGDVIFYDWDDNGVGDCTGWPEHVGMVEKVSGSMITVIEGNKSNAVGRRNIEVNGKNIRGYGLPNYASKATADSGSGSGSTTALKYKVGDVVTFTGSKHYKSADAASGSACKAGKAKVTATYKTGKHPYHLIAVSGGGSTVYGWIDADDIGGTTAAPAAPAPSTGKITKLGTADSFKSSIAGTYKTTTELNLRYGPDSDKYGIITELPKGTTVRCYGYYTGAWYYVVAAGKTGFVHSKYISK